MADCGLPDYECLGFKAPDPFDPQPYRFPLAMYAVGEGLYIPDMHGWIWSLDWNFLKMKQL